MSISPELMYAILAMDAYNRGYNPGIFLTGNQVGTATITTDSETTPETSGEGKDAGFYAVSYQWNGETIISYRGTDNFADLPWSDNDPGGGTDFWNGYGTGVGLPVTNQAKLAADFYQAVTGTENSDPLTGSATLVGHSLGGGLAGFIGALYQENYTIFNSMPFELAAQSASQLASISNTLGIDLKNDFYNGLTPWAPLIGSNQQEAYAVTGEILDILTLGRIFQNTTRVRPEYLL